MTIGIRQPRLRRREPLIQGVDFTAAHGQPIEPILDRLQQLPRLALLLVHRFSKTGAGASRRVEPFGHGLMQAIQPGQGVIDVCGNSRSLAKPGDLGVHFPDHLGDAARIQQRPVDRLLLVLERLHLDVDALRQGVQGLQVAGRVE